MYEVKLSNGTKLDFNKEGKVTEMDGKMAIPSKAISAGKKFKNHLNTIYNSAEITCRELDDDGQEVKLSDGTELEFDVQENVLKED